MTKPYDALCIWNAKKAVGESVILMGRLIAAHHPHVGTSWLDDAIARAVTISQELDAMQAEIDRPRSIAEPRPGSVTFVGDEANE